jgi:hypothetical protein
MATTAASDVSSKVEWTMLASAAINEVRVPCLAHFQLLGPRHSDSVDGMTDGATMRRFLTTVSLHNFKSLLKSDEISDI